MLKFSLIPNCFVILPNSTKYKKDSTEQNRTSSFGIKCIITRIEVDLLSWQNILSLEELFFSLKPIFPCFYYSRWFLFLFQCKAHLVWHCVLTNLTHFTGETLGWELRPRCWEMSALSTVLSLLNLPKANNVIRTLYHLFQH